MGTGDSRSLNSAENNAGKKQDNGINDSLSSQEGQAGKQPWDTSEVSKGIGKSPIGVQSIKAPLKGKKKSGYCPRFWRWNHYWNRWNYYF